MPWKQFLLTGDAAVLSDTAPVDVDFTAAAAGSATDASRQDHKHDVPEASLGDLQPVDGTAESLGSANTFLRGDHVHALGPLVATLDFSEEEATALALENAQAADAIITTKLGRIYFDETADRHPYIYTA